MHCGRPDRSKSRKLRSRLTLFGLATVYLCECAIGAEVHQPNQVAQLRGNVKHWLIPWTKRNAELRPNAGVSMSQPNFSALSVLIVDGVCAMRASIAAQLRILGVHDIAEAPDGEAALERLRSHPKAIVIADLSNQPMDGIEFTRRLRQPGNGPVSSVPVLMVCAHPEAGHVKKALEAGVTDFLVKPITCAGLQTRLAGIMERPNALVQTQPYCGPDRRRSSVSVWKDRRKSRDRDATFV
jgi:two-component system chemotaxis response regulator CheY